MRISTSIECGKREGSLAVPERVRAHVALLVNFIPPHQLPVYVELSRRVEKLTVLLSTPMEPNRSWEPQWGTLDVRVQRTSTFRRRWRHESGFSDTLHVHVPWDTISLLKKIRPDVIISGEFGLRSLLSALYRIRSRGTPLIVGAGLSEHTERGRGWLRCLLRKWLIGHADCVMVNGRSGARYLERLGCDRRRIFDVPYTPVPDSLYRGSASREPGVAHRLLYVGQLVQRKGILPFTRDLARWAAAHPTRQVDFTIVGSGPIREKLESLERPRNLALKLLGQQSFETIARCYADAGIFVFPSLADEWGLVVNEAMWAGLPVLGSTYSQAVEDLCVDGKTGWTFRPDADGAVQRALDTALSTPADELNEMRLAARACVEHITPRYAAERILEAIQAARGGR